MIDQIPQRIEINDIYFIIRLSRWGEIEHSTSRTRGSLSVEDYIHIYCPDHPENIGSHIPIRHVESLSWKILLFTIARVNGYAALHQAS